MAARRMFAYAVFIAAACVLCWPGVAKAATLDRQTLADQKNALVTAMKEFGAAVGWKYEESSADQMDLAGLRFDGATAYLALQAAPASDTADDGMFLAIQFSSPEAAKKANDERRLGWWPTGSETAPIGNHKASIGSEYQPVLEAAAAGIAWQCGNLENLVVLGQLMITSTDPASAQESKTRITGMAQTLHDRLVQNAVCGSEYRLEIEQPADLPLRLSLQLQKKDPKTGEYEDYEKQGIPVILELSDPPEGKDSFLQCIRADKPAAGGTEIDMAGFYMRQYTQVRFDSYYGGSYYSTDTTGRLEIPLTSFASKEIAPVKNLTAPAGSYRLNFSVLGDRLYQNMNAGSRQGLTMTAKAYAAPGLPRLEATATPWKFEDFHAASEPVTIEVPAVAEIIDASTTRQIRESDTGVKGKTVAQVRHLWEKDAKTASAWVDVRYPEKTPFDLLPMDQVSLGDKDTVVVRWLNGSVFTFTANSEAIKKEGDRVEFTISPTQPEDVLDRANFPDSVRKYLAVSKSYDPVIATGGEMAGSAAQWVIIRGLKAIGGVAEVVIEKGVEWTLGVVVYAVEKTSPTPVLITRIKSEALYRMGDQPEVYLVEGSLELLDGTDEFGETATQTLAPGQALRFESNWQSPSVASFSSSELPQTIRDSLDELDRVQKDLATRAPATSGAESSGSGAGDSFWGSLRVRLGHYWWVVVTAVVALVVIVASARRAARRRRRIVPVGAGAPTPGPGTFPVLSPPGPGPGVAPGGASRGGSAAISTSPSPRASVASEGWHMARGRQTYGPFSWNDMCAMAQSGRLVQQDLVWHPSRPIWGPAGAIPELFMRPRGR